jgi:hypothetical protein
VTGVAAIAAEGVGWRLRMKLTRGSPNSERLEPGEFIFRHLPFFSGAIMKPTTTTVKVCSTELDGSRSKEPVTDGYREGPPESTTGVRTVQPQ